jgi:murein DD-endopeptidase MepM/ murein hydrolase activator NlpD
MGKDSKTYYTVMFVPNDEAKPFSIRIHKNIIRSLAVFFLFFAAVVVFFLLTVGRIGVQLQLVDKLRKDRQQIEQENATLAYALHRAQKAEVLSTYIGRLAAVSRADGPQSAEILAKLRAARLESAPQESIAAVSRLGSKSTATSAEGLHPGAEVSDRDMLTSIPNITPVDGWLTKQFLPAGAGRASPHPGQDFAAAEGAPIRATAPGVVESVVTDRYYGILVTLRHRYKFTTRYGHCSRALVSPGELVERGQTVALVGSTGHSTAPHVHYEVQRDGVAVDPRTYVFSSGTE